MPSRLLSFRLNIQKQTCPRISFVTSIKNRLIHLKETLPANLKSNINFTNLEFVILDYNSTDGLSNWIQTNFPVELDSGRIKLYRTEFPQYFEMAKAKNIVHHLSTGTILCNLDADQFTGLGFAKYLSDTLHLDPSLVLTGHHSIIQGSSGRIALHRKAFFKLNGYDEALVGYGYEDEDLVHRCQKFGLSQEFLPAQFLECIKHSNALRSENLPPFFQNVELWTNINRQISRRRAQMYPPKRNFGLNWGQTALCRKLNSIS